MRCPTCNAASRVLYTRHAASRRRECFNGHRFSTVEAVATPRYLWAPEQVAQLRVLYVDHSATECAALMNIGLSALLNKVAKLGLKKTREWKAQRARQTIAQLDHAARAHLFKPGNVPWNDGKPGLTGKHPNTAANHFKKGTLNGTAALNVAPVGALRINSDHVLERKIGTAAGGPHLRWHPVHRLVLEAAHGPVPRGHIAVFKPGRKTTELEAITLDAVELVTRAEHMRRNSLHTNYPPELARLTQLRGVLSRKINHRTKKDADQ